MKVVRLVEPDSIRPLHVVMVCLVAATVAGSCLLTSGPNSILEGARDWREESPLRAVVHVLNLNYTQTTALGIEIKLLVFGIGASVAAMALGLSLAVQSPTQDEATSEDMVVSEWPAEHAGANLLRRQIPPLPFAQLLMAAYVLWSFLSTQWSTAPDLALGGSIALGIGVVWSLALGRGLNRPTANVGGSILMGVCAVTAVLAIAYYDERNPTRRAQYPLGNPLFLAACLIPGLILSVSTFCASLGAMIKRRRHAHWVTILLCLVAIGLMAWTVRLTGARSGALACACGLAALVFFMVRPRAKIPVAAGATLLAVAGLWFYVLPQISAPSRTGRDASLRLRAYAWGYAVDLIERAKIIGHGQGGYTQFGDALAAEKDVNIDPMALKDRIAHAHNEWLEVWSDLGLVGFMLVVGAMGLTIWAGMSALPKLPNVFWRWTLAALMASLVAMIVEECADVGLRVAGLPAVFYTVLGLIWALSRKPATTLSGPLHRSLWLGRVGGGGCIALGVLLLTASMGDFQSARAYYEISPMLQRRSFDEAVRLADRASRGRLAPQRRLETFERQCSTLLYIAREYQTSSLDRYARARQSDPPDANLMRLANSDRRRCEAHIAKAREAFESLVRRSPNYWGAGWLELRLYQLRTVYAEVDGDLELAARTMAPAKDALKRELRRRPFDPIIALTYVQIARESIALSEKFDIIAKPLRYATIPSEYAGFLVAESTAGDFDAEFSAMSWDGRPADATADPQDRFLPEKLRLAANIHFMRHDYARALRTGQNALLWYDRVVPQGPMATAACLYELAEYQFFSDPATWQESLEHAERAIRLMPDSTPGRRMVRSIEDRMVIYYLAGGDESSAGALLKKNDPGKSDSLVTAELGSRYAAFCKRLISRRREKFPEDFEKWVQRATELHPSNELAWRLSAQVAFENNHLEESVNSLRRALSHGADPKVIYAFVRLALADHAGQPDFQKLEAELRAILQPTREQTSAGDASDTSGKTLPFGAE